MNWLKNNKRKILLTLFLMTEAVLYGLILTSGGKLLIWSEYISIILCFLFSLFCFQKPLLIGGLALTLCADFCLVICDPIQQLWGMVFFLGAQTFYAAHLHVYDKRASLLIIRLVLTIAGLGIALLVLGENVDALALVSIAYYANLIMNLIVSATQWKKCKLLPIGFLLFILCDTVIGLQVASMGYLPIAEGSFLHKLIFMPFNLSWFFYLPSQVLIALSCLRKGANNENKKK